MERNAKENAGFYAIGIIAVIIAVLGISANVIYSHAGGYALGAGLVAVAFLFECFLFSISPKVAKARTKGILFFSAFILTIYAILFIFGDLAGIKVYKSVYTNGVYSSKLQPFGVFALVFEVACLILTVFFVSRMVLNLFGKEFKFYEKLLGTTVLRFKERDTLELDLPPKDTDKLIASAKRTLGHDDKLLNAIENAKPESEEKHKTPIVKDAEKNEKRSYTVETPDKRLKTNVRYDNKESIDNDIRKQTLLNEDIVHQEENVVNGEPAVVIEDNSNSSEEIVSVVEPEIPTSEIQNPDHDTDSHNDENAYDINVTGELYADSTDVGGVLSEYEIHEDIRKDGISNRITEQIDNPEDDIYSLFDYDTDDE